MQYGQKGGDQPKTESTRRWPWRVSSSPHRESRRCAACRGRQCSMHQRVLHAHATTPHPNTNAKAAAAAHSAAMRGPSPASERSKWCAPGVVAKIERAPLPSVQGTSAPGGHRRHSTPKSTASTQDADTRAVNLSAPSPSSSPSSSILKTLPMPSLSCASSWPRLWSLAGVTATAKR